MSSLTISVLLPTYKPREDYLREAVRSVLAQTHPHWTLLIRDDPSDVATGDIVRPYLKDGRIRFEQNPRRLGIGGNWNACLRKAQGDAIAYLFQDDAWDPAYLERGVEALERHPSAGIVALSHVYATDGSRESEAFLGNAGYGAVREARLATLQPGIQDGKEFLRAWIRKGLRPNLVGEPSFVMLRRSVMEQAGAFLEDMPQALDTEEWTRVLLRCDLVFVPQDSGSFRVHPESASMRNDQAGAGLADRLRCLHLLTRRAVPRDIRCEACSAFTAQLAGMAGKLGRRIGGGKRVGGGLFRVLPLLLRHPILTMRGIFAP